MFGRSGAAHARLYRFPRGLLVRLSTGSGQVASHFDAEYGPAVSEGTAKPHIEVHARRWDRLADLPGFDGAGACEHRERHKTIRWKVGISGLDGPVTHLAFQGRGEMAISFLQTFYLEPLIRLRMADMDACLVHACTVAHEGRAALLVGGTGVGKTTVATLHAARGGKVLGDNYVVVTPDGKTHTFPRRVRVYSDLPRANPEAYQRLALSRRLRLRALGVVKALSLEYANMPLRIKIDELSPDRQQSQANPVSLGAAYLLTAHSGGELLGPREVSATEVIDKIEAINRDEGDRVMRMLANCPDAADESRWQRTREKEEAVLAEALKGLPTFEILVPRVPDPVRIASELLRICRPG